MTGLGRLIMDLLRGVDEPSVSRTERVARREARDRGFQLLSQYLSPVQLAQYRTRGYFEVIGGDTGKRYRIRCGDQMNIEELDRSGRCAYALCFKPEGELPVGDTMLAQKIALEHYESDALSVAHRCSLWGDVARNEIRFLGHRGFR